MRIFKTCSVVTAEGFLLGQGEALLRVWTVGAKTPMGRLKQDHIAVVRRNGTWQYKLVEQLLAESSVQIIVVPGRLDDEQAARARDRGVTCMTICSAATSNFFGHNDEVVVRVQKAIAGYVGEIVTR